MELPHLREAHEPLDEPRHRVHHRRAQLEHRGEQQRLPWMHVHRLGIDVCMLERRGGRPRRRERRVGRREERGAGADDEVEELPEKV